MQDLFHGSQLEIFGRYRASSAGPVSPVLTGYTGAGRQTFRLAAAFPEVDTSREYLAPLWASRKIGYLIEQIRLHGRSQELVDELVRLSMEYGILTDETAFLAVEPAFADESTLAMEAADRFSAKSAMGPAGPSAVTQSVNAQSMQTGSSWSTQNTYLDAEGNRQTVENIQNVGQRAFVQRGTRWEDTRWTSGQEIALQVQAYSEAYFQLSRAFPELNSQMAVGEHVLVLLNGQAIEIGAVGTTKLSAGQLNSLAQGNI
jgi:Ca-activated chloride channel family protein